MHKIHKILLLNPPGKKRYIRDLYCSKISAGFYYWQPADLLLVGAHLQKDFTIQCIDAIIERFTPLETLRRIRQNKYDAVISLIGSASLHEDLEFLRKIKAQTHCLILVSGDIVTDRQNKILETWPFIDALITDFSTPEILSFLRHFPDPDVRPYKLIAYRLGQRIIHQTGDYQGGEFEIPLPPHHLFKLNHYELPFFQRRGVATVLGALGCPFQCSFCISGTMPLKIRRVANLILELKYLHSLGITEISFRDPLFEANPAHTKELCQEMIKAKLPLHWCCNSRVDTVIRDPELIPLMKKAGCFMVNFGVESGNDTILKSINKGITRYQIKKAFRACKRNKISTCGYFIIGLPEDNAASIRQTIKFAQELDPAYAVFSIPSPDYRTKLRKYFLEQGLIENRIVQFDRGGGAGAMGGTKSLTKKEVWAWQQRAFRQFYFRPRYILKRLPEINNPYKLKIVFQELRSLIHNYFV